MQPAAGGWYRLAVRLGRRGRGCVGRRRRGQGEQPHGGRGVPGQSRTVEVVGRGEAVEAHRRGATMSLAGWLRTRRGAMRRARGRGGADSHNCISGKF